MRGVGKQAGMELPPFLVGSVLRTLTMCLVGFLSGEWSSRNQQIWTHLHLFPTGNDGSSTQLNRSSSLVDAITHVLIFNPMKIRQRVARL